MATLGQYLIIKWDGNIIAGTRSNDIQSESEIKEIASPSQGSAREFIAGRTSWQVTVGWLLSSVEDIQHLLSVGQTYALSFVDNTDNTSLVEGSAILKTCKITATHGNLIQGSFVFQGTGALG